MSGVLIKHETFNLDKPMTTIKAINSIVLNYFNSNYQRAFVFFILSCMMAPLHSVSQEEKKVIPDGTEGMYFKIPGVDSVTGKPEKLENNEFENDISTFRIGLGYNHDFVTYAADDVFRQQMDSAGLEIGPTFKLRDFRILGSGRLKTNRTLSWKFAYMWDGDNEKWLVRESGITVGVPELAGHIFIGRTKEGFSMVKVMNGHSPWTMERQMAIDLIPIMADGIKWFGFLPKSRIFWNLGYFNDLISEGQGFSTFEWQYVARVGWMPFYDKENSKLLHIAANLRYGKPLNGQFRIKTRPESNPSPYFIDTGVEPFSTDHSNHIGLEAYYSSGRLMIGSEVVMHTFTSDVLETHKFYGGDIVLSYFLTGTSRPYNTVGSIYGFIPVRKSVFKGGWGEWEGVLRLSTFDLNDGSIQGGQFTRITPMINWYMSKALRFEFVYGYGILDRFNLVGATHMFQVRGQITVF
jgi:phosphate-selective porin OprO/OprP